jgi:hypothetical protein
MSGNWKNITAIVFLVFFGKNFISADPINTEHTVVFSNLEWRNIDGSIIEKAHTRDTIKIYSQIQGVPDGSRAQIRITNFYKNYEEQDLIDVIECVVTNNRIEIEWEVVKMSSGKDSGTNFANEIAIHGFTRLDYYFVVSCNGYSSSKSRPLSIRHWFNIRVLGQGDGKTRPGIPFDYVSPGGSRTRVVSDQDGYIKIFDILEHAPNHHLYKLDE